MHFFLLNNKFSKLRNRNDILLNAMQIWSKFPYEILNKIFDLLPDINKVFLNKKYYFKYHYIIKSNININYYNSYIDNMIKDDNSFVMERILNENLVKWIHWKNYRNRIVYPSYLYFIYTLILKYNSLKCKLIFIKVLEKYFEEFSNKKRKGKEKNSSFNVKNWFKNNNIKYVSIEWIN
jgi:hypothetical protein